MTDVPDLDDVGERCRLSPILHFCTKLFRYILKVAKPSANRGGTVGFQKLPPSPKGACDFGAFLGCVQQVIKLQHISACVRNTLTGKM
jgi:hypothetical protein